MKVRVGASTDVGLVRERNEDGYLVQDPLFVVADGMGGHRGGEVASKVALDSLAAAKPDTDGDALVDGVRAANRAVHERAESDPQLSGMGTTLTAILAGAGVVHLAHVGDSRAYLLREGELRQVSEDHTVVEQLIQEGRLTPEEAEIHPHRSILTRALGVEEEVEVSAQTLRVEVGDRLLLCSDGLTTMVGQEEIADVLSKEKDPQKAADALVAAANEAGGVDNTTAIVVDVLETEKPRAEPTAVLTRPPPKPKAEAKAKPKARTPPAKEAASRWSVLRPSRRVLIAAGIVVLVLAGAAFGGKLYLDGQWFVGETAGNVALYRGIPAEPLGFDLFTLVEETDLPAERISALHPDWRRLEDGIPGGSEQKARALIDQMRADFEVLEEQEAREARRQSKRNKP